MSENVIHSNDIAVTDFENDHIFVLHSKVKKATTQSSQTLETEIGGSSECIGTSHSTAYSDNELSIIRNVLSPSSDSDNDHVFVIHPNCRRDSNQTAQSMENGDIKDNTSYTSGVSIKLDSFQYAVTSVTIQNSYRGTNYLKRIKLYFTINQDDAFNWTIMQTWYNMEFLLCAVPFYIRRNGETKEFEKVSFRPQQVMWAVSTVLLVLEMLSWIPKLLRELEQDPNPYVYLRLASFVAAIILRCCFLNLTCCNEKLVIDYLKINEKLFDMIPDNRRWYNASKIMMVITCISVATMNVIAVTLGILLQAYLQASELGWTGKVFLYAYTCYGRELFWIGNATCFDVDQDLIELKTTVSDDLFGIIGLVTSANGCLSLQNSILSIMACTSTLCLAVQSVRHAEAVPTLERYNMLKDTAEILSATVGGVLTAYMMYIAISLPNWILLIFQNHKLVVVSVTFNLVVLLTTKLLACVATLQIDRMKSRLTGPEGITELPNEMKLFTSTFQALFHTSIGIGYPGLFVLNFRLLFSYFGIVCSIIVVLHETMKDLGKDD